VPEISIRVEHKSGQLDTVHMAGDRSGVLEYLQRTRELPESLVAALIMMMKAEGECTLTNNVGSRGDADRFTVIVCLRVGGNAVILAVRRS